MRRYKLPTSLAFLGWLAITCGPRAELTSEAVEGLLAKYITLDLTADLSHLSDSQRRMLPLLIEAAQAMDEVFWLQAYGDKGALLDGIDDPGLRRFALINYGPWDRLAGNEPFLPGVDSKPPGANFYPEDMTAEEFQNAYPGLPERHTALAGLYTMVRRTPEGELIAVPYSEAFAEQYGRAAAKLREGG